MKTINKIFSAVIAAVMLSQLFVVNTFAETSAAVSYEFSSETAGVADGVITVSGIPADASYVKLSWGSDENNVLEGYSPIKLYTSSADVAYNEEALSLSDGNLSYTVEGSRYMPGEAKYIIAEIINADGTVTVVNQKIEKSGFDESDMLYSMFWISDTHSRWISYKESSNLNKGFRIMRAIADKDGEKFKGVIINGDMADSSKDYEYGILENIIDNTMEDDYPVYYNVGNHDLVMYGSENYVSATDIRFDKLADMGYTFDKTDEWSYDTYIEGQHYIFLASPVSSSYELSTAQYEWLEAKLSEGDKSGVKNYLFVHLTVKDTVPGSSRSGCLNDNSDEFTAVMKRHPDTVVMTSHIHLDLDTDMKTVVVNSGAEAYLDTSSLYYTNIYPNAADAGVSLKDKGNAYGRYAQVYEDKVVVRTMNFKKNTWVPRAEYVIFVNNTAEFDGDVSILNSSEGLVAGNELTAKLNGNDINTDKYICEWYISGSGLVGSDVNYTIAEADKNVSLKVTDKETGAYAYATTGVYSYTEPEKDDTDTLAPPVITNDNTVVENDGVIMITGNAGTENAGKNVMLVIAPADSYNDLSAAKYINEVTAGEDGSYTFKFKADGVNENDILMAKIDGKAITNSVITVKEAGTFGVNMSMTLSDENIPSLSIVNNYLDTTENVKVVVATYDENGRMIKADTDDWNMVFGTFGEIQKYKYSSAAEGTTVKAFLFSDFETVKPLTESCSANIPVVEE